MRTLIVSDLHLGNGGEYETFAGGSELTTLLDREAARAGTRVVLNGDCADFLMNDDPLALDPVRAAVQADAICEAPASREVLRAFGRVLAAGGEVVFRQGNHDVELALPEVQARFRAALGQPAGVAARLAFETGEAPAVMEVGGARIVVTHGEHEDEMNRIEYQELLDGTRTIVPGMFRYPPGSRLVKALLNPLKKQHRMRYMDLLKPDFRGAVLAALAANPGATKVLLKTASLRIAGGWLANLLTPDPFAGETPPDDVDLGEVLAELRPELSEAEARALAEMLGEQDATAGEPIMFGGDDAAARAAGKLLRAALDGYARAHRRLADMGAPHFELAPSEREWKSARRLADRHAATACIFGHTHAARWRSEEGFTYANTGTWIWLMDLPPRDASVDEWVGFLDELSANPSLDSAKGLRFTKLRSRFTYVLIEPREGGGATIVLREQAGGASIELGRAGAG